MFNTAVVQFAYTPFNNVLSIVEDTNLVDTSALFQLRKKEES